MTEPNQKIINHAQCNISDDNKDINKIRNFNNNKYFAFVGRCKNTIENKNNAINDNNDIENINDDSGNLNINEIINQKKENNINKKIENNVNKATENNNDNNSHNQNIINITKTIDNENKRREIFARKRYYSLSNIREINTPIYCKIYEKINIFNAMLLSLNNNSFIDKIFKNQKNEQILLLEKNNKHCLSSILYNSFKFMWIVNYNSGITKDNLIKKYNEFIKVYSENNCKSVDKEKYCFDINNLVLIIDFIYNKINAEFTQLQKMKSNTNKNYLNNCFNNQYDAASVYLNNFFQNNISFISDNFVGFYQQEINCNNCQSKSYIYNMPYSPTYNYSYYTYIHFDLNEVNDYLNRFNSNFNANKNINLDNCFNYTFNQKFKYSNLYCNNCFTPFKYQSTTIYSLSRKFTIILTNNDYNFIIQEEIDLTKYSFKTDGIMDYYLISVLCKINTTEFILYNFNHKTGLWYSYANGHISQVNKMDINAIPLVLIYQIKREMNFLYESLKIEEKVNLRVRFSNRKEEKMAFPKNSLIKNVIARIGRLINVDVKKINILINAQTPKDYDQLSNHIKNTDIILVLVKD